MAFIYNKVYVWNYKVERVSTGIVLRLQEWDTLKSCVKELLQMEPELRMNQEWISTSTTIIF